MAQKGSKGSSKCFHLKTIEMLMKISFKRLQRIVKSENCDFSKIILKNIGFSMFFNEFGGPGASIWVNINKTVTNHFEKHFFTKNLKVGTRMDPRSVQGRFLQPLSSHFARQGGHD